jgi:outer membrane protein TolC
MNMKSKTTQILERIRNAGCFARVSVAVCALLLIWIVSAVPGQAGQSRLSDGRSLPVKSLNAFEASAQSAPEVLAAAAELEVHLGNLDQVQAETGLRVFAGSSIGQYREQVTADRIRDYNRISLTAGLRYPLLGSKYQAQKELLQARSLVREKHHDREQALRSSRLSLRLNYINYWAAQEKSQLTERFLENDSEVSEILQERTRASFLLEADRREFMAAFAMARRNLARYQVARHRAASMLALLTGSALDPFVASFPDLPAPVPDVDRLLTLIGDTHPLILGLEEKVDECRGLVELSEKAYPKGFVALSSSVSSDLNDAPPGYGVALEVNLDFPFKLKQADTAKRASARATLEKAKQELQMTRGRLLADAQADMNQYLAGEAEIDFALQRVAAAHEQIRENLLRSAYLAGDVIENLQKSRLAYYQAALDYIDAQSQQLLAQARILDYAPSIAATNPSSSNGPAGGYSDLPEGDAFESFGTPHGPPPVASPGTTEPAAIGPSLFQGLPHLSVYVWNSERLLRKFAEQSDFWDSLVQSGVRRLLISFTAHQIEALEQAARRRQVIDLVHAAQLRGLRIELLLGEPLWILQQFRPQLLALIRRLADIPFQGLHLDLEPNQLISDAYDEHDLQVQLLDTLKAVKAITDLPVGLSIHYRYMSPAPEKGICLGCAFKDLGVDEVTLMIYASNPGRVAQIAGPILARFPELTFSVAQSVEPILLPEESYFTQSKGRFLEQMRSLRTALGFDNFRSVLIQSWEDYCEMKP